MSDELRFPRFFLCVSVLPELGIADEEMLRPTQNRDK